MTFVAPLAADLEAIVHAVAPPELADKIFCTGGGARRERGVKRSGA